MKPYIIYSFTRPHLGIGSDDKIEFTAESRQQAWATAQHLIYAARKEGRHFPHPITDAYRIHNFLKEGVFDQQGRAKYMEYRQRPGDIQYIPTHIDFGGWISRTGEFV